MTATRFWARGATHAGQRLVPATVLVALPAILYAPFLFGGKVLYWGVYLLQFYPWRQFAVEQLRAGHWPLWNPYLGAGTPLAANLQTAAFYPPNVLFLLMPVERAFGWELALHVALAGLFAYYLGRTLGLSRFGALVSGLAYGLGGYLVAHWVFPTMVCAAAWLPLMLALTERLIRHVEHGARAPGRVLRGARSAGRIAPLSAVIALQLLAGHAQTSFYSLLIVAAFGLTRIAQAASRTTHRKQDPARSSLLAAGRLLLAACWGVALAAVQLLPTAELAAHSQRAGTLTDLRFAFELSFWPWRLITLLAPDFFGNPARGGYWAYGTYWEESAFVGVLPILLAFLALAAWWAKRRLGREAPLVHVPFFGALSLVSLVLALGQHTPLYPLLFRFVPGFGLFQAPARLIIGYALAMAVLAGVGANALRLTQRTRSLLRALVLAGMGAALAGGVALLALPAVRSSFGASILRLGLTLALGAGLLLLPGSRLGRRRWQALVVALVAADLLAFGWGLAPGTEPAAYEAPVATAGFLQAQPPGRTLVAPAYAEETYDRYVSLRTFGPSDPAYLQGLRESLLPNQGVVAHLPAVGNYDPLTVGLYRDLWDLLAGQAADAMANEGHPALLDLFAARYIVTDDPLPLPQIYGAGPRIYRNEAALPEAYVVYQARTIEEPEARLAALRDPAFDPRSEVILSTNAPPLNPAPVVAESEERPPIVQRIAPGTTEVRLSLARAGYLVLADTYYPGWRATVDGEPAEILPADHAFRAVALEAGDHSVVFRYEPLSFRAGAWITAGTAVLLALALGYALQRRRTGTDHA